MLPWADHSKALNGKPKLATMCYTHMTTTSAACAAYIPVPVLEASSTKRLYRGHAHAPQNKTDRRQNRTPYHSRLLADVAHTHKNSEQKSFTMDQNITPALFKTSSDDNMHLCLIKLPRQSLHQIITHPLALLVGQFPDNRVLHFVSIVFVGVLQSALHPEHQQSACRQTNGTQEYAGAHVLVARTPSPFAWAPQTERKVPQVGLLDLDWTGRRWALEAEPRPPAKTPGTPPGVSTQGCVGAGDWGLQLDPATQASGTT